MTMYTADVHSYKHSNKHSTTLDNKYLHRTSCAARLILLTHTHVYNMEQHAQGTRRVQSVSE